MNLYMEFSSKKFRLFKLFFLFLIFGMNLTAQENPSVVVENSVQAIGGKKELAKIQSIKASADCEGPNGKYRTEIFSANNSRLIFKQIRQNSGTFTGQTNGQIFWTTDAKTGDFRFADKRAAFVWRSHDFQRLAVSIDEFFRELTFAGEESFDGKPAIKLRGNDELGNTANIFFDKETKLILGFTIQDPFSEKPEVIRIVFNEWKNIGKLKLPSKITATDKQGDFILNFYEISLNKIDENIFSIPTKVTAMKELSEINDQQRIAHFNRDAKLLVSNFADDFTEIGNGKIRKPSRETSLNRFQNYLNNSTFLEWDDITPPVIKVSDDATLGYVIVHKKVRLLAKDEDGKEREETEVFAWLATYQKIKNVWRLTAIASTNTPEKDQ